MSLCRLFIVELEDVMKTVVHTTAGFAGLLACCMAFLSHAAESGASLEQALSDIEQRFDEISFSTVGKRSRRAGFEELIHMASALVSANPNSAEALTWQGIVLSSYAGEVSAFSAMKYANAALESLQTAESLDATALDGSVYTSLGALYAKVPGGLIGFGDDDLALDYLRRALEISPNDLDANYFLADLLVDKGMHAEARQVLSRALTIPPVTQRPLLDEARRSAMQTLLDELKGQDA
jgi:tetratricopeptide (TPR) repeat protein